MKKNFFKLAAPVICSWFYMSATNCEQAPVEGRQLKKNIKLMQLDASNFLDNSGFSFSEVAQSQFSGVLFEKNYFFERNIYPIAEEVNTNKIMVQESMQKASIESAQITQMKSWFPEMKSQEVPLSKDSSCLISRPQHFIAGKINALEAYSGAALQFGFNSSVVQLPISANFNLDKMRMDLSFHAFDPWTQQIISSVNSEAFKKDYKVGFGIDLGIIHIGPEFYRITGMAEVTLKGLQNAVTDLATKLLSTPGQDWSTRVMYSRDNYVVILGGAELGIKNGDQFKIYNEVHSWLGQPCGDSSILNGSTIVSDMQDPWIVEIEDAGNLMSKARVLNVKENSSIDLGAMVKLHQFVQVKPDAVPPK